MNKKEEFLENLKKTVLLISSNENTIITSKPELKDEIIKLISKSQNLMNNLNNEDLQWVNSEYQKWFSNNEVLQKANSRILNRLKNIKK